jgi:hypothetical protein
MKHVKIILLVFILFITVGFGEGVPESRIKDCKFRNKNLYGRVKIVTAFPDFRVKVVESFPDLRVMRVDAFADKCGKWKFVDAHEDFTVMFVDAHEDFSIKYVTSLIEN